jgi:8-oxo-dGTP pyrophosphatase MutT (NUDIX family)
MSERDQPRVEAAVALVTNRSKQVLLVLNDLWSAFSPPMTKRRRGKLENEPMPRAAIRAAVEALGVPVRPVEGEHQRLAAPLQSGRQLVVKNYSFDIYHIEPHPHFADRLHIRRPHLWLSPHQVVSGEYGPISESARVIVRAVLKDFKIPARVQHTSALVFRRNHSERGLQFLLRQNPEWGYTLPTKRWDPPDNSKPEDLPALARAAAERAAREELGLEPAKDVTLTTARSAEFSTHGVSESQGAPAHGAETDYIHSLFDAELRHPEKLKSDRALAWITPEEIQYRWTAAAQGEAGAPHGSSGRVSHTAYEILVHLGLTPEAEDPEIDALIKEQISEFGKQWLTEFGGLNG